MTKLLFASTVGSRAFGLHSQDSDIDVRGVSLTTLEDLATPFKTEAPTLTNLREGTDFFCYDFKQFVALLLKGDINAWVTLMSAQVVEGHAAQVELRHIAVANLLDWEALMASAQKMLSAGLKMVNQMPFTGTEDKTWKLVQLGLRSTIFALNMGDFGYVFHPCSLGTYRKRLLGIRNEQAREELDRLVAELEARQPQTIRKPAPSEIINRRLLRFYQDHL